MDYLLDNNTILYKSVFNNDLQKKLIEPCWFSLDKQIAKEYASTFTLPNKPAELYSFKLSRDLKFLNLLSLKFKLDFWDQINMLYTNDNCKDKRKALCLIALGLPSLETQELMVRKVPECDNTIKAWGNMIGGHRCTSPDGDRELVVAIMKIYPEYDGYIQPVHIPSCYHGQYFAREVCIFSTQNKLNNLTLIEKIYKSNSSQYGGTFIDENVKARELITHDDWKNSLDNFLDSVGYKGKIEYDKFGKQIHVSYDQIIKDRQRQDNEQKLLIEAKQKPLKKFILNSKMELIEINK